MQRKSIFIFLFLTGFLTFGQECPSLTFPVDGATNVPIDLTITWNSVENIEGFLLSLGTTPGGNNILNSRSAGNINYFTPDTGLPAHTVIYATISLFMGEGEGLKVCSSEVFTTETITELPPCTALNIPVNNATEVRPGAEIFWNYSFSAIGYLLSIGTSSGEYDILFDVDVGNVLSYRPDQDFPVNQDIYVTLVPYNENGERTNCVEERFRTGSNNIDCSEFLPIIDIPDQVGICVNDFPKRILGNVASSGVRWFKINNDNSETLLSENPEYFIEEVGLYRYEVYNEVSLFGDTGQCMASKEFTVIVSEHPQISNVDISRGRQGLNIVVGAIGTGDYEYAVENRVNSYQDSPIFQNIEPTDLTIYVRDK
ncbi:MAG: hypothetical protein HKN31_04210, partial [Pricia sp.]|nr:hypothetical protein [Pricia sp.]